MTGDAAVSPDRKDKSYDSGSCSKNTVFAGRQSLDCGSNSGSAGKRPVDARQIRQGIRGEIRRSLRCAPRDCRQQRNQRPGNHSAVSWDRRTGRTRPDQHLFRHRRCCCACRRKSRFAGHGSRIIFRSARRSGKKPDAENGRRDRCAHRGHRFGANARPGGTGEQRKASGLSKMPPMRTAPRCDPQKRAPSASPAPSASIQPRS